MPAFTRQTAIPCTLEELKGQWVQQTELPSGVQTEKGIVNRTSIMGTIVDKQESTIVLDDGTTTITARSFETQPLEIRAEVGDSVLVIGKPREYNGERYLLMEICKKIAKEWLTYRKKELGRTPSATPAPIPTPTQETVEVPAEESPFEKLIKKIRELDTGDGADTQDVLDQIEHEEKEKLLQTLIEEGEIFENKPGKLKVLE